MPFTVYAVSLVNESRLLVFMKYARQFLWQVKNNVVILRKHIRLHDGNEVTAVRVVSIKWHYICCMLVNRSMKVLIRIPVASCVILFYSYSPLFFYAFHPTFCHSCFLSSPAASSISRVYFCSITRFFLNHVIWSYARLVKKCNSFYGSLPSSLRRSK